MELAYLGAAIGAGLGVIGGKADMVKGFCHHRELE